MDRTCFEAELILLLPIVVVQSPHPHTLPHRLLVEGVGATIGLAGVEGVAAFIIGPLGAVGLPTVVAAHATAKRKRGCRSGQGMEDWGRHRVPLEGCCSFPEATGEQWLQHDPSS